MTAESKYRVEPHPVYEDADELADMRCPECGSEVNVWWVEVTPKGESPRRFRAQRITCSAEHPPLTGKKRK